MTRTNPTNQKSEAVMYNNALDVLSEMIREAPDGKAQAEITRMYNEAKFTMGEGELYRHMAQLRCKILELK